MRSLPDINVWIALCIPAHTHHHLAVQWAKGDPSESLFFCRYTQQGLLRLITTAAVTTLFKQAPLSNHEALRTMAGILEDGNVQFATEPENIFPHWSAYADVRTASPKLWMDAYLAAFARCGGYRLVTTDKGFKQFKGIEVLLLK